MLEKTGLSSYQELALWAKERVQLRRIGEINSAFHRNDLGRLFMEHFKMSGYEARQTYRVLVREGHIREYEGSGNALSDDVGLGESPFSISASGLDPGHSYLYSTWEL